MIGETRAAHRQHTGNVRSETVERETGRGYVAHNGVVE
jgi:hypothetical protein